ncbi:MAG: sigma-70 family RNA polymerase sigma factor [Verrucomicrobiaceae bacterium]|nr:sigma-70 family RNA polymerase sigma factor [Verrucomicrobiaceae bacterium]
MSLPSATTLNPSDEELMQGVAATDERAFQTLYDRFSPPLFALLRQMLDDEKDAEDVLQEGFLYLWDRAKNFDPSRAKAFTWATMIFRHKAIDRIRSQGRRHRMTERAAIELPTLLGSSPAQADDEASAQDHRSLLAKALQTLPSEQRSLIECAFLKGLTHHSISESLGLPLGTVKTNIRRGLIRLRDILQGGLA